jgi:hypothetical protein
MIRRRGWFVVALVMLAVVGCQAAGPTPSPPTLVAIPTAEPLRPGDGCMDALMSGVLAADPQMGLAVQAPDGAAIVVVWPHGWAAVDQDGMRILVNDRGAPVARVGDHVEIGGGQGPDGRWYTCGEVTRVP